MEITQDDVGHIDGCRLGRISLLILQAEDLATKNGIIDRREHPVSINKGDLPLRVASPKTYPLRRADLVNIMWGFDTAFFCGTTARLGSSGKPYRPHSARHETKALPDSYTGPFWGRETSLHPGNEGLACHKTWQGITVCSNGK